MKKSSFWKIYILLISSLVVLCFVIELIVLAVLVKLNIVKELNTLPMIVLPAIAFSLSLTITLIIGRMVLGPIDRISNAMSKVAAGDFAVRMNENHMMANIRRMNTNFNKMVRELDSTEMLKSDFIADVSHEFKTPIAAIEGYASLLAASDLTAEQRDYADHIMAGTARLSTLTGNILRLSKLEKQQFHQEKNTFSLDEQLRQEILLFENSWSEKEIEIVPELEPVFYTGYEDLLSGVWNNLISNAIKFTPKGGAIYFELVEKNDHVLVSVRDTGIGMNEEEQLHAFDKFYQADNNHSVAGNGLGLALAKQIVQMHDGTITIKSAPGEGSTFYVRLPKSSLDKV